MKATGIVRRLDCLGRICIPKELLENLNFKDCQIEIYLEEDRVIMQKFEKEEQVNCEDCIYKKLYGLRDK